MATRTRSLLFLNFRAALRKTNDYSEHTSLVSHEHVAIELAALPPRWSLDVERVETAFAAIKAKTAALLTLYKKTALPAFGLADSERNIAQITEDLTALFTDAQRSIKRIADKSSSADSQRLALNIQKSLAGKLQSLSSVFKKAQSAHLAKLRSIEAGSHKSQAQGNTNENINDDLDSIVFAPNNPQSQVLQTQGNAALITKRESEINTIADSIVALAQMFQELNSLVVEQGTLVDSIDYNVQMANVHLEGAHEELGKGSAIQKKGNKFTWIVIVILSLVVLIMVIVLYFKLKKK